MGNIFRSSNRTRRNRRRVPQSLAIPSVSSEHEDQDQDQNQDQGQELLLYGCGGNLDFDPREMHNEREIEHAVNSLFNKLKDKHTDKDEFKNQLRLWYKSQVNAKLVCLFDNLDKYVVHKFNQQQKLEFDSLTKSLNNIITNYIEGVTDYKSYIKYKQRAEERLKNLFDGNKIVTDFLDYLDVLDKSLGIDYRVFDIYWNNGQECIDCVGEVKDDQGKNICAVCYEILDDDCVKLPCNHCFHKQCLIAGDVESSSHKRLCPMCRTKYFGKRKSRRSRSKKKTRSKRKTGSKTRSKKRRSKKKKSI
jgi:hypothetical protein